MKRVNFYFPTELLTRLKSAKLATGMPVSEIIRRAVGEWLDNEDTQDLIIAKERLKTLNKARKIKLEDL